MVFKIFTRAIILDENDRVLLLKKNSKQKYWAWELMLPGWTLEFWEEITETLVREIKEETNLTVDKFILFDTVKMIIWEEHWLWVYYLATVENLSDLKNMEPEKHEFCWFLDYKEIELFDKDLIEKYFFNKQKKLDKF